MEVRGKYNNAIIYTDNVEQEAVGQVIELLNQPAFEGVKVRIMPDTHAGAGCVIGFTANASDKVVPNLIGVDIGCGMYVVNLGKVELNLPELDMYIRQNIPHGFKNNNKIKARIPEGLKKDIIDIADKMDKDFGTFLKAVGSLGGGNHFIEVNVDSDGNKYLVIHSGSRNFGKCIADYHQHIAIKYCQEKSRWNQDETIIEKLKSEDRYSEIESYLEEMKKNNIYRVPKQLSFLEGELRENYLYDLEVAKQYAELSRESMAERIVKFLGVEPVGSFHTVHNYIDSKGMIRKGAIDADEGLIVLIPLNMRDGSILARGKGNVEWNCSAPHGAGRLMSRSKAKAILNIDEFKDSMSEVYTTSVGQATLDEAPMAYKPAEEILEYIQDTVDIIDIIKPLYNFKAS